MKNKGFTLIEVLVVVIIIAVLALITSPIIIDLLKQNRQEMYENQVRSLEEAAKRWSVEHTAQIPDDIMNYEDEKDKKSYCLSLEELADKGYISGSDLINPVTEENLVGSILISYDKTYQQFTFKFVESTC